MPLLLNANLIIFLNKTTSIIIYLIYFFVKIIINIFAV